MRRVKKLIWNCWSTVPEMAVRLGMSEATIIEHLHKLDGYKTFKVEQYRRAVTSTALYRVVPRA